MGLFGPERKDNGTSMGKPMTPKLSKSVSVSVDIPPVENLSVLDSSLDTSVETVVDDTEADPDFTPMEEDTPAHRLVLVFP